MPFDYFVVGAAARELHEQLQGGRVEKIYQPEREELLFHINVPPAGGRGSARHNLRMSAGSNRPLLYLTEQRSGNPQNPPAFCMLLRKHLMNGRILGISQVDSERMVRIDLAVTGELGVAKHRILLLELMGKHSNIFLLTPTADDIEGKAADIEISGLPTGRITGAIKLVPEDMNRYRTTLPGCPYVPPPQGKGISPVMAEEITLGHDLAWFQRRAEEGAYQPLLYLDEDGKMRDFHVFPLACYAGLQTRPCPSVSAMLEAWCEGKDEGNRIQQKSADLSRLLKSRTDKLYLKKQRLSEDLLKAEKADEQRELGALLTANIYRLEKGLKEVELTGFDGEKTVKVALDPRLTPAQNAQRYFKQYSKAKTAQVEKQKQLTETEAHIAFLESYRVFLDNARTDSDVDELREELSQLGYARRRKHAPRQSSQTPKPLEYRSASGRTIYVGRNNRENDLLTLKRAKATDLWLHTKDIPGSHVILAGGQEPPDEQSIRQAAAIAAWYSKAKESENVPVDYTLVKYVKKPAGGKPGMVIFTHNRTIYVKPTLP